MAKELPLYNIIPLNDAVEVFSSLNISSLKGIVKADNVYAFITNLPTPFLFDINLQKVTTIPAGDSPKSAFTSIAMSPNREFLATGHADGSICYWSIPLCKPIKSVTKSKYHKTKITNISFGVGNDTIFAGDSNGVLTRTRFVKRIMMLSDQDEILNLNKPIELMKICQKENHPEIGFVSTGESLSVFSQPDVGKDNRVIFKVINYDSHICFDMIEKNSGVYTVICGSGFIELYKWTPAQQMPNLRAVERRLWRAEFPDEVFGNVFLLSSVITCAFTTNGVIKLLTKSSEDVGSGVFTLWNDVQQSNSQIISAGDDLMVFSFNMPAAIKFTNWKEKVKYYTSQPKFCQKDYDKAFSILVEIEVGTSISTIGLSPNKTIRRLEVAKVGKEVAKSYIKAIINEPDVDTKVAFLITYTNTLNISRDVVSYAMPLFKEADKMEEFFTGIFGSINSDITRPPECGQIITTDLANEYFQYAESKGMLSQAEDLIASLKLDQSQAKSLLALAKAKNMITLQKKILIVFYKNFVLPAQIYYNAGRLAEYCKEILGRKMDFAKKTLTVWLMVPQNGTYERLSNLIHTSKENCLQFISSIMSLFPIAYTAGKVIRLPDFIDAVLRCINDDSFDDVHEILTLILPVIFHNKLEISGASLKNIVYWIFIERVNIETREYILSLIIDKYPDLFKMEIVENICQTCGFIELAKKIFVPRKEYTRVFRSCFMSADRQREVFDVIRENKEDKEIRVAITDNINELIQIDTRETASVLKENFPELLESLKKSLVGTDRVKLLFALYNSRDPSEEFDDEFMIELFEAACIDSKKSAINILRSSIDNECFDTEKALKIAEKYNVIDCIIELHIHMDNKLKACELVGQEIQNSLLEFTDSEFKVKVESIDQISGIRKLERPYSAIQTAINLLHQITDKAEAKKRWVETYLSFQFPIYRVKFIENDNIKSAITYLFTMFVVASLNDISSNLVFSCIDIYFCAIDQRLYREILNAIFSRLDYQVMLNSCVEEMLIDDCITLSDRAFQARSHGYQTDEHPTCAICHQSLKKSIDSFKVFPCGHCMHENATCGHHDRCVICSGSNAVVKATNSSEVRRNFKKLMKRFNFSMSNTFEEVTDNDVYISPVRISGMPKIFDDGYLDKVPNLGTQVIEGGELYFAQ